MNVPDRTAPFGDVATLLRDRAASRGDAVALETADGETTSYAELHDRAGRIAAALGAAVQSRGGRPRIGIVLPNGPDMAVSLLGVCLVGVALPFNPAYTAAEFEAYFRETAVDVLLTREGDDGPAVAAAGRLALPIAYLSKDGGGIVGVGAVGAASPPPARADVALVLLTSGSTGRAKAVPLTHGNICTSAVEVCRSMDLGPDDRCLSMWEQYHIGGLVDLLLAPLASGGTVICTDGFDAAEFFKVLEARRPTWFQGVPTTLNELVVQAERRPAPPRPNTLRLIRSVAAALQPRLMSDLEGLFGVPVIQTFGMTEAGPLVTSTRLPPALRKPGSTGRSCGTEIKVVDPSGKPCEPGIDGDIAIRGDNVFSGYENDAAANAAQFRDGWFYTGDIGHLDVDGDLFLTGRTKQLINRGGEKINPQEVDDALCSMTAVLEAASFAVKHPTLGEDIAAAVVARQADTLGEARIRSYLSERLASFKVPQRILFLERLPRNPVGKIDRLALSALAEELAKTDGGGYAPPRNDLERFLARLWATELGVDRVGIDDDFTMLGGDSLSSLRILMAVEAEFDVSIMGEDAAAAMTVRSMAETLAKMGCDIAGDRASPHETKGLSS